MLNVYVISTGHDMVIDTDIFTMCRSKKEALPIKRKLQNVKFLRKTWVGPNNHLMISDQKLKNLTLGIRDQNKRITRTQKQQLEMDLVKCMNEI